MPLSYSRRTPSTGGGWLLRGVCRASKRNGSPCTAAVSGSNGYCWAHDPANVATRRRTLRWRLLLLKRGGGCG
jgi:hypothetical protein